MKVRTFLYQVSLALKAVLQHFSPFPPSLLGPPICPPGLMEPIRRVRHSSHVTSLTEVLCDARQRTHLARAEGHDTRARHPATRSVRPWDVELGDELR